MTLLVAALVAGWPFFHAALAAGADDALDALSRTYSYLNQRLVLFAVGVALAWAVGMAGLALVDLLARGVIRLTQWSLSLSGPARIDRLALLVGTAPIDARSPRRLIVSGSVVSGCWPTPGSYSFFWTAAALLYLWLRHEVDGTPTTIDRPARRHAGGRPTPAKTYAHRLAHPPAGDEISLEDGANDGEVGFEQEVVRVGLVAVGQGDDGEVGRLAGLEAAGGGLGTKRPGAEKGGHGQEQLAGERLVTTVEEPHLVEQAEASRLDARLSVPRQTITPRSSSAR